ncbi:MAG: AsnC family transcriptional regulator [Candidatus Micrarchaeaceae archaeon]
MENYGYSRKAILRGLSENSRESVTKLAGIAKCSRVTARSHIKELERELKIKYTLELDEEKLGIGRGHFIMLKLGKPIQYEEAKSIFANDSIAQMVAITEGMFDMLVYAIAPTGKEYIKWETKLGESLSKYKAEIRPSQVAIFHIGFVPLLNSFISSIDFSKIMLDEIDKKIIMALNDNSRASINEIARLVGIKEDTARYRMLRIKKSGIIRRFTLAIQNINELSTLAYFVNYRFAEGMEARGKVARHIYQTIDGKLPVINAYQLLAPTSGAYRFFAITTGYSKEEAMKNGVEMQEQVFSKDSAKVTYAWIKKVAKGMLAIRNIDVSKSYNTIVWE